MLPIRVRPDSPYRSFAHMEFSRYNVRLMRPAHGTNFDNLDLSEFVRRTFLSPSVVLSPLRHTIVCVLTNRTKVKMFRVATSPVSNALVQNVQLGRNLSVVQCPTQPMCPPLNAITFYSPVAVTVQRASEIPASTFGVVNLRHELR